MKRIILFLALSLLSISFIRANDGVYYVSGNQLVPLKETDISVKKEILTISLQDDGMAKVDVYYEFYNNGVDKDVLMGFEAAPPYNTNSAFSPKGIHPYIHDFTVEMNGKFLRHETSVCLLPGIDAQVNEKLMSINMGKWKYNKEHSEEGMLYNEELDSICAFAYVYHFKASFQKGLNIVRHTYRCKLSFDVYTLFSFNYKLSPATRWANHQIDDFTLRIKAEHTAKNFFVDVAPFNLDGFQIVEGEGKTRRANWYNTPVVEFTLRDATVEWHATNFSPKEELNISSADVLYLGQNKYYLGCFYDRSDDFNPCRFLNGSSVDLRLLRNLPFAHRGYVFKDKKLQQFFKKQWWYMPNPQWKSSTVDFKKSELQYIQGKVQNK